MKSFTMKSLLEKVSRVKTGILVEAVRLVECDMMDAESAPGGGIVPVPSAGAWKCE
jgi:hypothetical protein